MQIEKSEKLFLKLLSENNEYESFNYMKADIYDNLGGINRSKEKIGQAIINYEFSLEILKNTVVYNHRKVAKILNHLGKLYKQVKKYERSIEYFQECLEILKNISNCKYDPDVAFIMNDLGSSYLSLHKYS